MLNKLLPWLYRFLALLFIFLFSFTSIYTITLFTPGIDGGDYPYYCPSAFSNPEPDVNKISADDDKYYAELYQKEFDDIEKTGDEIKNETDDAKRLILVKKSFLNLVELEFTRVSNDRLRRIESNSVLQVCAADRRDLNSDKDSTVVIFLNDDGTTKNVSDEVGAPTIDDRGIFHRYLTITNVAILWTLVILLGGLLYYLRKKLEHVKRVNKLFRIVVCAIVTIVFSFLVIAPVLFISDLEGYDEKACAAADGFDMPNYSHDVRGIGLYNIMLSYSDLTESSNDTIESFDENVDEVLDDSQKAYLIKENDLIRKEALKLEADIKKSSVYKKQAENAKLADPLCIRDARLRYLLSTFYFIVLIMFWLFIKGKKDNNVTLESANDEVKSEDVVENPQSS